jgi:Carboxypeptidase regulatory-like domain
MRQLIRLIAILPLLGAIAFASIFGAVRGVIHDPQHRPIRGAHVTLKANHSNWTRSYDSNDNGEFNFASVPVGDYTVTVSSKGFRDMQQSVIVQSDTSPVLHFGLPVAAANEAVEVSEIPVEATTETMTPTTMLNRMDIQETPGADRTNAMQMITDYVPRPLPG